MLRALMGVLPDETMPDMSDFPPERLRTAPESNWDERRFRPNMLVHTPGLDGYPEAGWLRRRFRIGSAVVEAVAACPRCVMVTQPVDELPADPRVMRTLVRETRHTAGIYARVVEEGEVRVGDVVEALAGS